MIGKTVDNYRITDRIGEGGMGVVYKASHNTLYIDVAIKMIHPALAADPKILKNFRREARNQARLSHRNVVSVKDFRKTPDGWIIVMDYIEGDSLTDLIKAAPGKKLPLSQALDIMKQLLAGLAHAHENGIVHYDIKPRNMLIGDDDTVHLVDFGLAKAQVKEGETTFMHTVSTLEGGTPYYMSPEQILSSPDINHRTDIFSLGISFYEMLAGRKPIDERSSIFEIQQKILQEKFPSLRRFNRDVPKKLSAIVMKMIDKAPEKRYQNAGDILADIHEFEKSTQTPLKPASRPFPVMRTALGFLLVFLLAWPGILYQNEIKSFLGNLFTPNSNITKPLEDNSGEISEIKLHEPGDKTETEIIKTTALVSIEVNPGDATVKVGDRQISASDLSRLELKAGKHTVDITREGYTSLRRDIDIIAGKDTSLSFVLFALPIEGGIHFTSIPSGAAVYLNGQRLSGTTPFSIDEIEVGRQQVEFRKRGYRPDRHTVRVTAGESVPVQGRLQALTGRLNLTVIPSGDVFIDSRRQSGATNGAYRLDLSPGSHRLEIKENNVVKWQQTINITAEGEISRRVDFNEKIKVVIACGGAGWAHVLVNDKNQGEAPGHLELPVGIHTIRVERSGYSLVGGPQKIQLENGMGEQRLKFQLQKN